MSSTTQRDVANALTEAMQKIAESNTQSKEATLVIEAEIVEIVDEGLGTYIVKYLGNKFNATTAHTEILYEVGDMVYVIIPNGNFDKNKIILSPVTPSTAVYASTEGGSSYITIGDNLFKSVADVSLCTYKPHDADISGTDPSPIVDIDTTGFGALFKSALTDSRTFNFTCKIQTNIEKSRRSKGNYGLVLDIPIIQPIDGIETKKYYSIVMDINNITGDPYNLSVPALQNFYFTLPNDMIYDDTNEPRIRSFVTGFIGKDDTKPDDIFITEIQLLSTLEVEEDEMSGYYSVITASGGNSFLASRTGDAKTLSVTAYLNGKVTQISKFDCYWFKENATIDTNSDKFQRFGGIGWEILNKVSQKNINEDGKINYQYVTNVYTQIVSQSEIHCDTRFKCVLVKGDKVITSIVTIKNLASDAILELSPVNGSTIFPIGIGNAELQLKYFESGITNVNTPNFIIGYAWQRLDKKGNYIDNDFYIIDEFNTKIDNTYYTKIHYPVSEIDEANTIACTAYLDTPNEDGNSVRRQIIGTVWLTITTNEAINGRVIITNGDKLYKYDADGDSPMVADYDGPLSSAVKSIDPISVKAFHEDGTEFTFDEYKVTTVKWLVPINSMIKLSSLQKEDVETNPGYYTISGKYNTNYELKYSIDNTYNKNKLDNTILVQVSAPSAILKGILTGVANIRFLKDGEGGTNGTKYSAILTYGGYGYGEKDANGKIHKLQLVYVADRGIWYLYNPADPSIYTEFNSAKLMAELYADGEKVSSSSSVQWGIFDNTYSNAEDKIVSPVTINNGEIVLNGNNWTNLINNFCATIEAKVMANRTSTVSSQTNSEEYVYAYYPIECSYVTKYEYLKSCVPTLQGGFYKVLYAADGTNPQYDNSEDFYAIDTLYNDDISDLYDYSWTTSSNMKTANSSGPTCKVTPTSKYDNGVAKNFVRVNISRNSSKTNKIIAKRDALNIEKIDTMNRLSYYETLQNNLDIFANFDYNSYINRLTDASKFYSVKTNLTKTIQQLLRQLSTLYFLCGQYKDTSAGIDNKVNDLYNEVSEKINQLNELAILCAKLGTTSDIIDQIKAIAPSSLIINNKISYSGVPARNCYFTLNDSVDLYNNTVNAVYTTYVNELDIEGLEFLDTIVRTVIFELRNFVNSDKLENLTKTYERYNEEAYRYFALKETLASRINSTAEQTNTYSYALVIENIIKPMYNSLSWYITFYNNGGYNSLINNITDKINELNNKITLLSNMLLPNDSVNIIHIKPIIMVYNRYELSHINGWDGNKLETGDGYLIAPQVGAGKKSDSNTFTGIVMGVKQVAEKTSASQKIGLFGYSGGIQSLFLNAEDGSALFGKSGYGQIILDPTQNRGLLYSSNFWKNYKVDGKPSSYNTFNYNKRGMLIDLTTPEIRFGNGNFVLDSSGHITAAGGGSIAGWDIDDSTIHSKISIASGRLVLDSGATVSGYNAKGEKVYTASAPGKIYTGTHNTLNSTSNGFYLSQDGLSIGSKVYIDNTGIMRVGTGAVANTNRHWTIDGGEESYIGYNANSFESSNLDNRDAYVIGGTINSVYIGTDGIRLGNKFAVDRQGNLVTKNLIANRSGCIAGWTINQTTLTGGSMEINSNGSIKGGSSYSWSIGTDGTATFNHIYAEGRGRIAGWNISSNALTGGSMTINSNGSIYGGSSYSWSIGTNGTARFSNMIITGGSLNINNQAIIDSTGTATFKKLYASVSGEIGGWQIGQNSLKSKTGNISLNADGSIVGPTWNISSTGVASFSDIIITGNGASPLTTDKSSLNWGDNFSVDGNGVLRCKKAIIQGSVTAGSGNIGGWTITSQGLSNGDFRLYSSGIIGCWNVYASGGIYMQNGEMVATRSWVQDWVGSNFKRKGEE